MLTTKPVYKHFRGYLCRRSLSREYRVHMTPKDCRYQRVNLCPCCCASNHVVVGFTLRGHIKMLFKR